MTQVHVTVQQMFSAAGLSADSDQLFCLFCCDSGSCRSSADVSQTGNWPDQDVSTLILEERNTIFIILISSYITRGRNADLMTVYWKFSLKFNLFSVPNFSIESDLLRDDNTLISSGNIWMREQIKRYSLVCAQSYRS